MMFMVMRPIDIEGVEQETVDVTVRLGRDGFERLKTSGVPATGLWLADQHDGTFALGVTTRERPEALGFEARKVAVDDRAERFGGHPATRQLRAQLSKLLLHRDLCRDAGLDTAVADEVIEYVEREIARGEGRPYVSESDGPPSIDTLEGLRYLLAVRAAQTRLVVEMILMRGEEHDPETLSALDRVSRACADLGELVERKDWANKAGD